MKCLCSFWCVRLLWRREVVGNLCLSKSKTKPSQNNQPTNHHRHDHHQQNKKKTTTTTIKKKKIFFILFIYFFKVELGLKQYICRSLTIEYLTLELWICFCLYRIFLVVILPFIFHLYPVKTAFLFWYFISCHPWEHG